MNRDRQVVEVHELIEHFCAREDLATYDPYDIWKTSYGLHIKKLFNRRRLAGLIPASLLTLFDVYINNHLRLSYTRQEYPIVRAFAALALINLYHVEQKAEYLRFARMHMEWLTCNRSSNCSGYGWGLGFEHAATAKVIYDKNTPFSTITPYPLEAFVSYRDVTGDTQFDHVIRGVYDFLEHDIKIMIENERHLVTSYGTTRDRVVINAVSYTLYSYALLREYVDNVNQRSVNDKIVRLYQFVKDQQRGDGSWLYSPENKSFIDCFHSCIVLKNIVKADRLVNLDGAKQLVDRGYEYLKENFADKQSGLFRRFSLQNKPSLVKFDLYDNAEMLNLGILMRDWGLVERLSRAIAQTFRRGMDVYSQVDISGRRYNKNMLRWAVMPYLYALSFLPEVTRREK